MIRVTSFSMIQTPVITKAASECPQEQAKLQPDEGRVRGAPDPEPRLPQLPVSEVTLALALLSPVPPTPAQGFKVIQFHHLPK